ncbi:DUF2972 domain-containing protein, partial [Campylobacter jejuni subsp. jejuni]
GQTVIEHRHNGGGYIALFKKLYKIKKQHKQGQKIYQQTIQVFPQLKYPNLETCPDYNEALRCKFHLSYMIGEVLIKSYQNWYKGAGFKLKNNIKKANKEFQIFREILKQFKELNSESLKAIQDNKQLFLKEFPRIKNILKIHQDYKVISDNIFHNFNYFIQNFDLIEKWLLSDDFKERYKKENHPYPSLLDPKKLNDENEEINYHNIPAELAWEMNLPLPDRYEFVISFSYGSGHAALITYFNMCEVSVAYGFDENPKVYYKNLYNQLTRSFFKAICLNNYYQGLNSEDMGHIVSLSCNYKDTVLLVRDPISIQKTMLNHISYLYSRESLTIKPNDQNSINCFLNQWIYFFGSNKPNLNTLCDKWLYDNTIFAYSAIIDNTCKEKLYLLNFNDIYPKQVINTFQFLGEKYCFCIEGLVANHKEFPIAGIFSWFFPVNIEIANIKICLVTSWFYYGKYNKRSDLIDVTSFVLENHDIDLKCLVSLEDYKNFINYTDDIKRFVFKLFNLIEDRIAIERSRQISEQDIILFLLNRKIPARVFKDKIDYEIGYIKQHRPDIVASWKYYQEFEQMCKELDGNI